MPILELRSGPEQLRQLAQNDKLQGKVLRLCQTMVLGVAADLPSPATEHCGRPGWVPEVDHALGTCFADGE